MAHGKFLGVERKVRVGKVGGDGFYWSLNLWKRSDEPSPLGKGRWEGFRWVWSAGIQGLGVWKKGN